MLTDDPVLTLGIVRIVVALGAGLLSGFINTIAGNGSAITLPMFVFLGLDATTANGTNRVGVMAGALMGTRTFIRSGTLEAHGIGWMIGPCIAGAVVGATTASFTAPKAMEGIIVSVMFVMLALVLLRPQRWLEESTDPQRQYQKISRILIFFLIGFYGGFVQAGVGILLLAGLVLNAGYGMVKANAIKVVIVLVLTVPALIIFAIRGQVHWPLGALVACSQGAGAWLAANYAVRYSQANVWIRRLLIFMILVAIAKLSWPWLVQG